MKTIEREDARSLVRALSQLSVRASSAAEEVTAGSWANGYHLGKEDAYRASARLVEDLITEGGKES